VPKTPKTKPWREWQQAARGITEPDQDLKCDAFRAVQTSVVGSTENEWLNATKQVFECYAAVSVQDVTDILNWIKSTMAARAWNVAMASNILAGFHLNNPATGSTERQRVTDFLGDLNTAGVATNHINAFQIKLREATCIKLQISRMVSDDFLGLHKPKLVAICGAQGGTVPAWFKHALTHVAKCASGTFWLRETNDVQRIGAAGTVIYADEFWKTNAVFVNAYALISVKDDARKFHLIVTPAQWKDIAADALQKQVNDPSGSIIAIGAARNDDAALGALGTWIWRHREAVLMLVQHGYAAKVIAQMHVESFTHREIVTMTWFRGEAASIDESVLIMFKAGDEHGFYSARVRHLAERHLYKHFQFVAQPKWQGDEPIKDRNSFHPHGTTQQQLAGLNETVALPANADGEHTGGHYRVFTSRQHKRINSLYPVIAITHQDYYDRATLEKMKRVAALFPVAYKNSLPEIAWFNAPR
jgi:hypothetical protein